MATLKQIKYYESLCEQACIDTEDDYEEMEVGKMSGKIKELIEIVNGGTPEDMQSEGVPVPDDCDCAWVDQEEAMFGEVEEEPIEFPEWTEQQHDAVMERIRRENKQC